LDSGTIFVTLQPAVSQHDGRFAHFLFVAFVDLSMDLQGLLETTLSGLGYELVDLDRSGGGRLLRIFIDRPGGVGVDDCAAVSHHLTRVLAVENVNYDRLEVSSPGLDRLLKKEQDFARFTGHLARIRVRVPIDGRRNFVGVLREVRGGAVQLDVEGKLLSLDLGNLEKARLVPAL
jgi:ribosome maturation factor RimP